MRDLINRPAWVRDQYATDSNLNARIALHKSFNTSAVEWTHWVFDQILEQANGVNSDFLCILEVGAGPGNLWAENCDRIPANWRLALSDLSIGMAESARTKLTQAGISAGILVAGAEELPVASSACHVIVANHMLYHVENRERAIAEFRRALSPDGVLIAATNGDTHMHELHELVNRFDPSTAIDDHTPRQFSLQNGVEQLANQFSDVSVIHKEGELVVTEVEPLVAYMLSGSPAAISPERMEELRAFVEREMERTGAIRITPETGLLIARS